jgi:ABC-type multidrug transport system permease subunit
MFMLESINPLAVATAAVISFIVGSLWYSPFLFGRHWAKLAGIKKRKKGMQYGWGRFLVYFIGMLVTSFVLAHILLFTASTTVAEALVVSFWIWLGFVAPITLGGILWEKKPITLFVLNNAYNLLSLAIISTVLTTWR